MSVSPAHDGREERIRSVQVRKHAEEGAVADGFGSRAAEDLLRGHQSERRMRLQESVHHLIVLLRQERARGVALLFETYLALREYLQASV